MGTHSASGAMLLIASGIWNVFGTIRFSSSPSARTYNRGFGAGSSGGSGGGGFNRARLMLERSSWPSGAPQEQGPRRRRRRRVTLSTRSADNGGADGRA